MKNILIKLLAVLFAAVFLFYLFYSPSLKFDVLENPEKVSKPTEQINDNSTQPANPKLTKGIGVYIGRSINDFTDRYGYPKRIYPSKYSYDNYIFQFHDKYYICGVKDKRIVMIYATGKAADTYPLKITADAAQIFNGTTINTEPVIKTAKGKYRFELSEVDVKTQLLLQYGNIYAQVFVDRLTSKVMAVKYMTGPVLVEMQPYAMSYNGEIIERTPQQLDHTIDEISINSNNVLTMFELTNIMREINGRKPLATNELINHTAQFQVAELSRKSGKVVTQVENDIGTQLKDENIDYKDFAQNIAYNFEDVPSLINSWLNSDEHREQLLNSKFNEMGGGISGGYTSLVFIERAEGQ
ncbi:CAP domain-containing protein [Macrococcus equipercicus]|uniref:SCP-like extracellular protein n=1 Tax=Macrococcus equipercicus TaxID=69967 RepID=A0A9Q9BWV8_9STAP|nr:CAP-associated domain-containing protein [Macrococcus equipercicus]UTH14558.1 SCP-like extracellular protein [Macrococcus equipercicus]